MRKRPNEQRTSKASDLSKRAQEIGISLHTLLKLPKAYKWVCHEFFYGNIDQTLFNKNEFQTCLEEAFPNLKTRRLRRFEWMLIKRLLGKPRRCSQAFFDQERATLNEKRAKIRQLQQQKFVDINQFRDLPENIPLPLFVTTKVTALLRKPQDGLFTGVIDAVDASSGTYRITFDRPEIGTHSIPDYEVCTDEPEFISLSSFQAKVRPRLPNLSSPRFLNMFSSQSEGDSQMLTLGPGSTGNSTAPQIPFIKQEPGEPSQQTQGTTTGGAQEDGTLGNYPIKYLIRLVKLSKILNIKKKIIYELKSLNTEAERMRSLQQPINYEFKKQYASTILELERINIDLNGHLKSIQQFSQDFLMCNQNFSLISRVDDDSNKYLSPSRQIVDRCLQHVNVQSDHSVDLITHLLSLMLHLKNFSDIEISSMELTSLDDAVKACKKLCHPDNHNDFENHVEVPINHIQSTLSHLGNLGAFTETSME